MQLFKCDRCGTIMTVEKRFCVHYKGHIADLCKECHTEYEKDKASCERQHEKGQKAIAVKYGMLEIKEIILGKEYKK